MIISDKDLELVRKYIDKGVISYIGDGLYQIGNEYFSVKTGIGGCIQYCKEAEKLRKQIENNEIKIDDF